MAKWLYLLTLNILFAPYSHAGASDEQLAEWRERIREWAPLCQGVAAKEDCDDGDSTLWNGLLCHSGEAWACEAVKHMQSADGRVWRSPRRIGADVANSFSRDMTFGGLLYVLTTGDVTFGDKWAEYVIATGKLCPDDTDGRCDVTIAVVETWNQVANEVGFATLPLSIVFDDDQIAGDFGLFARAQAVDPGYEMHLIALHVLIRNQLNPTFWLDATRQKLAQREPGNPFYLWLETPAYPDVREAMAGQIPLTPPHRMYQWSLERETAETAWVDSMGWEFVFLINMIIGSEQGSE